MKVSRFYQGLAIGFALGIIGVFTSFETEISDSDFVPENAVLITYTVAPHSLEGVHKAIDYCNNKTGFVSTVKNEVIDNQVVSKISCLFIKHSPEPELLRV